MDHGSTATASHARQLSAPRNRSFSLRSDKSSEKGGVDGPVTAKELAEKARRDSILRGESKANPNAAILEVQPGVRNVLEKVTLDPLRETEHKDANGNVITEPDLSNPTRPRWERPLDTIRSFERAIDGGYKQRTMSRAGSDFDSSNQSTYNRRSNYGNAYASHTPRPDRRSNSHYTGYESGPGPNPNRNSQYGGGGYYGNRKTDSYFDPYGQAPSAPPSRNRYGRSFSESQNRNSYYGNQYSHSGYGQAYDANGSDSTGPWNNHTDPSSENSSLDRAYGITKPAHTPEPMAGYPGDAYGADAIMEEGGSDDYGLPVRRPTQTQNTSPRKTIQLGGGSDGGAPAAFASQGGSLPPTTRPVAQKEEKRKSFFGRKFSKNKD